MDDERENFIAGRTGDLAIRVAIGSLGLLFIIFTGLEYTMEFSIPISAVLGPYFAFITIFHLIAYHHYERMYR